MMVQQVAEIVSGFAPVLVFLLGASLALTIADWFLDHIWRIGR